MTTPMPFLCGYEPCVATSHNPEADHWTKVPDWQTIGPLWFCAPEHVRIRPPVKPPQGEDRSHIGVIE